jgi:hypothetical protein
LKTNRGPWLPRLPGAAPYCAGFQNRLDPLPPAAELPGSHNIKEAEIPL